jgi:hypothetical protein
MPVSQRLTAAVLSDVGACRGRRSSLLQDQVVVSAPSFKCSLDGLRKAPHTDLSPPILLREAFHRENATGETRGATHIWISRKFVAEVLSCSSCSSLALPVAAMVAAGFQGLSPSVFL